MYEQKQDRTDDSKHLDEGFNLSWSCLSHSNKVQKMSDSFPSNKRRKTNKNLIQVSKTIKRNKKLYIWKFQIMNERKIRTRTYKTCRELKRYNNNNKVNSYVKQYNVNTVDKPKKPWILVGYDLYVINFSMHASNKMVVCNPWFTQLGKNDSVTLSSSITLG